MPGVSENPVEKPASAPDRPVDDSAANNADGGDNPNEHVYEPPVGPREITQTDRLNKQLLESLLNRMHAAAQATSDNDSSSKDDTTTTPRNSIDWE